MSSPGIILDAIVKSTVEMRLWIQKALICHEDNCHRTDRIARFSGSPTRRCGHLRWRVQFLPRSGRAACAVGSGWAVGVRFTARPNRRGALSRPDARTNDGADVYRRPSWQPARWRDGLPLFKPQDAKAVVACSIDACAFHASRLAVVLPAGREASLSACWQTALRRRCLRSAFQMRSVDRGLGSPLGQTTSVPSQVVSSVNN